MRQEHANEHPPASKNLPADGVKLDGRDQSPRCRPVEKSRLFPVLPLYQNMTGDPTTSYPGECAGRKRASAPSGSRAWPKMLRSSTCSGRNARPAMSSCGNANSQRRPSIGRALARASRSSNCVYSRFPPGTQLRLDSAPRSRICPASGRPIVYVTHDRLSLTLAHDRRHEGCVVRSWARLTSL